MNPRKNRENTKIPARNQDTTTNGMTVRKIGRTKRKQVTTNKKTHNIEKVSKNSEESESEDESLWSHDSQELFSTNVVETESGNEMSGEILLSVLVEGVRKNVVALLDSGTSQSLLNTKLADENATIESRKTVRWEIKSGEFSTKKKALVKEC